MNNQYDLTIAQVCHVLPYQLAGPLFDERGILTADLDIDLIAKGKMDFAVAGHYLRKDIK